MFRYFIKLLAALSLCLCGSNILNICLSQYRYVVVDLGTMGETSSGAYGINDSGQVVGSAYSLPYAEDSHAFLWKNGVMEDLGTFGGTRSFAAGINDAGQVVGSFITSDEIEHAFRWVNGLWADLGTLGAPGSSAAGINDAGHVAGSATVSSGGGGGRGFIWRNGVMDSITLLSGWGVLKQAGSSAYGINNADHVVGGSSTLSSGLWHAFLWVSGVIEDLNTLGGQYSTAFGINDAGQVVGGADDLNGNTHAFLWQNDGMEDLHTLGGEYSQALGINDSGQVVGHASLEGFPGNIIYYAFLWENGVMTDLNSLIDPGAGWTLSEAYDISNKGMIVGSGVINGQTHAYLLVHHPIITRPRADTDKLWIAGEKDTIRWIGGYAGQFLQLEYSEDSNRTFKEIDFGIPADSGFFVWDKPDSILSTKCTIRIFDMTDTTIADTSDILKIKGYVLTKYDENGDYVPYNMPFDNWGFSNNNSDCWPESWYRRFDYRGTDPFTGRRYTQVIGQNFTVFATADSSDFPDWPSFVNTFGTGACYKGPNLGFYSPTALRKWEAIKDAWGGSCFGIAISNFLAWENRLTFQFRYPNFPTFGNPIEAYSDTNTISVINELFTHQFGNPHITYRANVGLKKKPTQTLKDLKQMFIKDGELVQTLSINNNTGKGGHAICPYKVKKVASNSSVFEVYVYDNSFPNDLNAHIVVDPAANGGDGSWYYSNWPGWGGSGKFYLRDPVSTYLANPTLNKVSSQESPFIVSGKILQICPPSNASAIIQDVNGNVTGYDNGDLVDDIPSSTPLVIDNSSETPPYGYELPADSYSVVTKNFTDNVSKVFFFTGNKTFVCERSSATQSQTDRLFFDGGVSAVNPDSQTKEVSLLNIINETTQEKLFAVTSLELVQNDSVRIENPDDERLKLISYGSAKSYDVELNFVSENHPLGNFVTVNVPLSANTSHTFVPDWSDITNTQLVVLVDDGNNGTIDDTLFISNIIADVKDRGNLMIPTEYYLAQNYPNPFNPATTIRYELPKASHVTLRVFNVLGQEVAMLADEMQEAGSKSVDWNASVYPSGVYFYRISAISISDKKTFTDLKKMLLLK